MVMITTSPSNLHAHNYLHYSPLQSYSIFILNPNHHHHHHHYSYSITHSRVRIRTVLITAINPSTAAKDSDLQLDSAANIVRSFYDGINHRELSSVENLIAENCVYEDLVFPKPFIGRNAILTFFEEFMSKISKDLQFAIDEISEEDSRAVGVTWHLEWKGKPFPFSKGCSFYKLEVFNGQKQIVYGRDVVEPFIKPGDTALIAIRAVTWLLQKFPKLAERF